MKWICTKTDEGEWHWRCGDYSIFVYCDGMFSPHFKGKKIKIGDNPVYRATLDYAKKYCRYHKRRNEQ